MSNPKHRSIEYRNYALPAYFPILLLSGEEWRISDVPSHVLHFHNCVEIGLCESDSGNMEFSNISSAFQEGDITFIAGEIPHTTYSAPGAASKWSYLFLNVEELLHPYFPVELISNRDMLDTLLHRYWAILPREKYPEIYMIVSEIIRELKAKELNFQFSVRGLMLTFMLKLLNIFSDKKEENGHEISPCENSLSISPALTYIQKHYKQDFPIDYLAELCDMSPTHFRRTFSSIMGVSPLKYLLRVRIIQATTLLRTTETPILNISEEVGFQSISTFNRNFMEIAGMKPMQYRKQMSCIRNQSILKYTGWMTPPKD